MKFSIVIPTFNNKVLLKNTLEALNNQTGYSYGEYEVVVVDDGSVDHTQDYIQGINRSYPLKYFYLERCADSCRARTRNHGWKNAAGEVIAFIDSDILVKSYYLQELNRCFSASKDIFVLGNRLMLDETIDYEDVAARLFLEKYPFDKEKYHLLEFRYFLYNVASFNSNTLMCPWIQTYSCNLATTKEWLEKVGGFDENFKAWGVEDVEIGYALYQAGARMIINSKLEVFHQYHGPRNDLIIEKEKVPGYERNIDYFMKKHPKALKKMTSKIAYKFLKGEMSSSKMLMTLPVEKVEIEFRDKTKLDQVKKLLFKLMKTKNVKLIVYDFVEDTDLDIWIQLLDNQVNSIWYYPMSKRIDVQKMLAFIDNEKRLQKIRNGCEAV